MNNSITYGIVLRGDGSSLGAAATQAEADLKKVGKAGEESGKQIKDGADKGREGVTNLAESLKQIKGGADKGREGVTNLAESLHSLGKIAIGGFVVTELASVATGIGKTADEYTGLQSRLKLATASQSEFNIASAGVYQIAQQNGAPLAESIALYARLAPTLAEAGRSQREVLQLTDMVGKSLRLSNASTAESSAAMLQFSQAMGSGVLRGDEFNSLMEASPRLMRALADGLGRNVGELRAMAEAGQLTSTIVANALLSQSEKITSEFTAMPLTVSMAWTKLGNAATQEIGKVNQELNATSSVAGGIDLLANNTDKLAAGLQGVAVAGAAWASLKIGQEAVSAGAGIMTKVAAIEAERVASIAAAEAEVASTAAALSRARANSLVAGSYAAVIAAEEAHAASILNLERASQAATVGSTALRGAVGLLGGPIGIVTTLLGVGATAWSLWGNSADEAAAKASDSVKQSTGDVISSLDKQIAKLKERNGVMSGDAVKGAGQADDATISALAEAERRMNSTAARAAQEVKDRGIHQAGFAEEARVAAQEYSILKRRIEELNQEREKEAQLKEKSAMADAAKKHPASTTVTAFDSGVSAIQMGEIKAQLEATGMSAQAAAAQVKVYELAIKGANEIEKMIGSERKAKSEAERQLIEGRIAARRREIDAEIEVAQASADRTIQLEESIKQQKAADKAWNDAGDYLQKLRDQTRLSNEDLVFQASLLGKSATEIARLNAENQARLKIEQEIAALQQKYKDNPGAADAGVAEIRKQAPSIISAAGDLAQQGAENGLAQQGAGLDKAGAEQAQYEQQLAAIQAWEDQKTAIAGQSEAERAKVAETAAKMRENVEKSHRQNLLGLLMSGQISFSNLEKLDGKGKLQFASQMSQMLLGQAAQHNKTAFEALKAVKLAEAAIMLPDTVMKAYNSGVEAGGPAGPAVGAAFAAIALATQLANMNAIASASFGGGASGTASAGAGGAGAGSIPGQATNSSVPYTGQQAGQNTQQPPAPQIHITLQALDPSAISDATLQRVGEALAPHVQQAMGNGAGQQTVIA